MIRKYGSYYINWSTIARVSVHDNQNEPFIHITWPGPENLTLVGKEARDAVHDLDYIITHLQRVHPNLGGAL